MEKTCRVMTKCFGGARNYWSEDCVGTRYECQKWIRNKARNGGYTASCRITTLTADKFRERNPL